jgi:hypothetical protein
MSKTGYLLVVLCLLCSNLLRAQAPAWGGGADQNDYSFGFTFSYIQSNFKIIKKPDWRSPYFDQLNNKYVTDSLNSINSNTLPGFAIGFLYRYSISDHLEVRTNPALIFADRSITYSYVTPSTDPVTKQIQATSADFPLEVKLKSDRIQDFRVYLLGGIKYTIAVGKGQPDANTALSQRLVKNAGGFGSYEAGIGCDIYFEFFKLSPEIKIANSFGNVLVPENQPFSSPISKLGLHTIMFSLIFE